MLAHSYLLTLLVCVSITVWLHFLCLYQVGSGRADGQLPRWPRWVWASPWAEMLCGVAGLLQHLPFLLGPKAQGQITHHHHYVNEIW